MNSTRLQIRSAARASAAQAGYTLLETMIVLIILAVMLAISLPFLMGSRRAFRSEDQAIKIMDLMRETAQLAMTRRRMMRFEIDATDNAMYIVDEAGADPTSATDNNRVLKKIFLDAKHEVRVDAIPAGVTAPNPPNYNNAVFAAYPSGFARGTQSVAGNSVWMARFNSNGSVVNSSGNPMSANLYVWTPIANNSSTPLDVRLVRAITIFGGTGAIRYWKHDGTRFNVVE